MKLCVYTCITGDYDNIKEVDDINLKEKIDFICYTNNRKLKSRTWKIVYIEDDKLTNVQLARRTKILGTDELKKYDMTVWMDADIQWETSIIDFVKKYVDLEKYDLVGFKHHSRNRIADEILACYEYDKITAEEALKIQKFYQQKEFKDDMGLIESTVLFRNFNNTTVQKTMEKWFYFIVNLTHRDQLSFNYVEYLNNLKVNLLDINVWNNEFFKYFRHSKTANSYIYYKKNGCFDLNVIVYSNTEGNNKITLKLDSNIEEIRVKFDGRYSIGLKNIKCKQAKEILPGNGVDLFSCDCPIVIELVGPFKKNDVIELSYDIEIKDVFELTKQILEQKQYINQILNDKEVTTKSYNEEIIKYQDFARQCREELDNVMNSRSMKITKPLRDAAEKINKIKGKKNKKEH